VKLAEILAKLNEISPFALSASWDNSGLQAGDLNAEIREIVLALECSSDAIAMTDNGALIITHHPLIFKPLLNLDFSRPIPALIGQIIKKDISVISMHTNFDVTHLNAAFAKLLGFDSVNCDGFICKAEFNGNFKELAKIICDNLGLSSVSVVEPRNDNVKSVAFCCGSGGDLIDKIDADVFITGDVKYHQALSAKERGLGVIDATHFASEKHFAPTLAGLIKDFGLPVKILEQSSPFKEIK
jgi:dinuclear metal center YbgI/SA1388 family protein